jgi:predicted outer membrane repeat protein
MIYLKNNYNNYLIVLLVVIFSAQNFPHEFLYVKADAAGTNNGLSWENAFNNLQDALAIAAPNDTIFVAAGSYYPDRGANVTRGNRATSFLLKTGVVIMGGYKGNEEFIRWETGADAQLNSQKFRRNWRENKTYLVGDLLENDNDNLSVDEPTRADNSIHIITTSVPMDSTTEINGFYIRGGNANSTYSQNGKGAAAYFADCSVQIKNCVFSDNTALESGGAIFANSGAIKIKFTEFENNTAPVGAAVAFYGTNTGNERTPSVINSFFYRNTAASQGGSISVSEGAVAFIANTVFTENTGSSGAGLYADEKSHPEITNCTFYNNTAVNAGGGAVLSAGRISNSIFRNNNAPAGAQVFAGPSPSDGSEIFTVIASVMQGGFTGEQVYDIDPEFAAPSNPLGDDNLFGTPDDGLRLLSSSPVIDSGLTWVNSEQSDILGCPRQSDNATDYGAYEYQRYREDLKTIYDYLKTGGYILLFRNALTDRSQSDQPNYLEDIQNCSLQRNLSAAGIKQAKYIGGSFRAMEILVDSSLTGPLCRTRETGQWLTRSHIISNNWLDDDPAYNQARLADLGEITKPGFNSVIVAEAEVIEAVTGITGIEVQEGDALVIKPLGGTNFQTIAHLTTDTWEKLTNFFPPVATSVNNSNNTIKGFYLSDNYPNPFNPATNIKYSIPVTEHVTLKIYDPMGKKVADLVDEIETPGDYKVKFNASGIASGVYFYTLSAGPFRQTKKLLLLK